MKLNRNGLPNQIVGYLHKYHNEWISKGTLTADMQWRNQTPGKNRGKRYLPETVGRALRSLEESSIIAVKDDGISVQYKWIPFELRGRYIPWTYRPMQSKGTLFKP